MRRTIYGLLLLLVGGTAAWTLTIPVKFPTSARVKPTALVDELGNVLFGTTPGKVEVTNFPTIVTTQLVTLLDGVQVPAGGSVPFGPVRVDGFRDAAFLWAGITGSSSAGVVFMSQSGSVSDLSIPRAYPTCLAPEMTIGVCNTTPVLGPFLAGSVYNGAGVPQTITLQAYLRP